MALSYTDSSSTLSTAEVVSATVESSKSLWPDVEAEDMLMSPLVELSPVGSTTGEELAPEASSSRSWTGAEGLGGAGGVSPEPEPDKSEAAPDWLLPKPGPEAKFSKMGRIRYQMAGSACQRMSGTSVTDTLFL